MITAQLSRLGGKISFAQTLYKYKALKEYFGDILRRESVDKVEGKVLLKSGEVLPINQRRKHLPEEN